MFSKLRKSWLFKSSLLTIVIIERPCHAWAETRIPVHEKYALLSQELKQIDNLNGVRNLLGWDEMVMLAPGSANARNEQKAALASVIFEKETSPKLNELINELLHGDLTALPSDYDRANVRDAARDFHITSLKTKDMAVRESELEGQGYQAWADARSKSQFSIFSPILSKIVDLKKEVALCTRPLLSPYDGNIDCFERGMKTERLEVILGSAKQRLVPLVASICQSDKKKQYTVPEALQGGDRWAVEQQVALCKEVADAIGFDFETGRLDVSVHPFTGGSHPTDVRITTRYSTDNWLSGIAGTVHEVGHALYEQGRNPKYDGLPVSRALSMGVHESQSLFWERMIFQSREFWVWATPLLHKHFPHTRDCSAEQLYEFVNQVEPGLIRVDADEVTYPLHILLRFELEKGLFDGSVAVDALPALWNAKMTESLGIDVPDDSKGVLQDIHWSIGAIGYFPSYTTGAMMAAQIFDAAEKQIPDIREKIKTGEFGPIRRWLRENIHEVGSLYASPDELLTAVTGKPLDPEIYVGYLENKYKELYNL